jgi:H+/Cl- antiporter ClcA
VLYKYLSKRTLCAKVLGLTCALASGLPLGKEGPFIHASCCLCEALLSLPLFRPLKASHATRMQMLMAACAVGVGANFGAPVGGVLLAIELTSTFFLVSIYWKCFYTAVMGAVLSRTLYMSYKTDTFIGAALALPVLPCLSCPACLALPVLPCLSCPACLALSLCSGCHP